MPHSGEPTGPASTERADHVAQDAAALALRALEASVATACASIDAASVHPPSSAARREAVRAARRELKAVRALVVLCRPASGASADAAIEFAAKTNQLLGPLRDRDALVRSIARLSERFADGEPRRVVRAVLLATLVLGDFDRTDDAQYSDLAIARARRAVRAARDAVSRLLCDVARAHDAQVVAHECCDDDRELRRHGKLRTRGELLLLREFASCRLELAQVLAEAHTASDLARLHDCRKRASFLALALRPLGDEVPRPIARLRMRAKRLASALGEDRDLALLDAEMTRARAQLTGSPLVGAIDEALRLARLETAARMEDAARAFLRLRRAPVRRALATAFGRD